MTAKPDDLTSPIASLSQRTDMHTASRHFHDAVQHLVWCTGEQLTATLVAYSDPATTEAEAGHIKDRYDKATWALGAFMAEHGLVTG